MAPRWSETKRAKCPDENRLSLVAACNGKKLKTSERNWKKKLLSEIKFSRRPMRGRNVEFQQRARARTRAGLKSTTHIM